MSVSPFELGLHAVEVGQIAVIRERAEGGGVFDGFGIRIVGFVELFFLLYHLCREQAGLGFIAAALAPAGVGHFYDQIHLDQIGRLESLDIGFEQEIVFVLVFIGQDYGTGIESMFEGVHGGFLAAFFGDRSVGFGAVGTG